MASRAELLSTKVTDRAVRRLAANSSGLLRAFGLQPGGRNVNPVRTRQGGYDIFDDTRTVGQHSTPGTPAKTIRRQPVGRVNYYIPRMAEQLFLTDEELYGNRPIGGDGGDIDLTGRSEIARQQRFLGQRTANWRLALFGGLIRGKVHVYKKGDNEYLTYSTGGNSGAQKLFTVNYQHESTHTAQLDMGTGSNILDASWDTATTDIPGHILSINRAFKRQSGGRLGSVIVNSNTWKHVIKNDEVKAIAGTTNTPYTEWTRGNDLDSDTSLPNTTMRAVIPGLPGVEWYITDEVIDIGPEGAESTTDLVPDGYAFFGPAASDRNDLFGMMECPEPIVERPGGPSVPRTGSYSWTFSSMNPAGTSLFSHDNSLPALYVPKAVAYGQVAF
ncbi:major capsid protein [Alienimonas sp. DA493]|uniref:major capsid protein n=1 Tax=Alienimonas sp. DA493 TaxID=3373605 RepID=UPI0037545361